jgi:hypothetical protein
MNVHRIHNSSLAQVPQRSAAPPEKPFADHLTHTTTKPSDEQQPVLTPSEKEFFVQLYPSSAEAVRSYTPYQRDGQRDAITLGSLLDRKG